MELDFLNNSLIDFNQNSYELNSCVFHKSTSELALDFRFQNALILSEYLSFIECFNKEFQEDDIKVNIKVSYENENLKEEEFRKYLEHVLDVQASIYPRFNALKGNKPKYEDHAFTFTVERDAHGLGRLALDLEEAFKSYGLNVSIFLEEDPNKCIADEIHKMDLEQRQTLKEMNDEAKSLQQKSKKMNEKDKYNRFIAPELSQIKDIPLTANELSIYTNESGIPIFTIQGEIFDIEIRSFTNSTLAVMKITDETDSIVVKKWLRGEKQIEGYKEIKSGDCVKVVGKAEFDPYAKNVVVMANQIDLLGHKEKEEIIDDALVKRVELHAHSKMSALDGLAEPLDYYDVCKKWGHKAIAITDHNGVYNIPDIYHARDKYEGIKPIYGVELNYIDDKKYYVAFDDRDIDLKTATFVVFDLETTGLSHERDTIIEIAATKYTISGETDSFETFVNPERPIPAKITEITSITDEMVADAPTLKEIMPKFLDFLDGSILVAHNAKFDVGMVHAKMDELGYDYVDYPVIDTLNALRALHFNELKKFNLKEFAKYYKVKQEHHHRAIDDTRVTAECFILMLQEFFQAGVDNYSKINKMLIKEDEFFKSQIPHHINILVKTQPGLKNMYKLLSDALTTHCFGEARLLRTVLEKYRDGILVGSGCVNGEVFQEALIGSYSKIKDLVEFYDYIEVQPPLAYKQLYKDMPNGEEVVKTCIRKIIEAAKEANKIVVATSDCHYIRKSEHKYRDILIASPQTGGAYHPLNRYEETPDMHFRTTNEMLEEFKFLGEELAYEIVVENTNKVADSIEEVEAFHKEMFAPRDDQFKDSLGVPSIVEALKSIVKENETKMYGENPHPIVTKRLNRELNSIISNGYSSVYYMSHLMVTKSLADGYLVGSRGSVGSSLVATMMQITEINPLAPHYRCKKCHFHAFKMNEKEKAEYGLREGEEQFQDVLQSVESGYDLPDAVCPICGEKLVKDGHDIPFETFLGFNGDKVPDIDLNFSGDYQPTAHLFVREFMGDEYAFRSGTVGTLAEKNAFGYVKGYCERKNKNLRSCEMDRISQKLVGVRRSTGQHPGGIIVVPNYVDIYDVTPIQYPADNIDNEWRTTHFDYHSFENNLLKLDILGHDDPTIIKYLMDYVHLHQDEFPFDNPQDIPIDDKNVYRLFSGTDVIGVKPEDIESVVASYAVPEFGTTFVRRLLSDTMPKTFAELVKISGLSHGTGVWAGNSQDLVLDKTEYGKIPFSDVIGCRDDIMVYLLYQGLEPLKAFEIMEFVRKGKLHKGQVEKWEKYKAYMQEMKVPEWFIWSCEQIEYMFPKAHATAYVLMALRIAWFKVYSPKLFYSAWFTARAKAHSVKAFLGGKIAIKAMIEELNNKPDKTAKDDDLVNALYVALEMVVRGIKFLPLDIEKSDATTYLVEDEGLRIPFSAVDGLGDAVAIDIVEKRNERPFTSKKDVLNRTRLNQTLYHEFELMHAFADLPDEDKEEEYGLFA